MRRGAGVGGLVALGALLGCSLVCCASASVSTARAAVLTSSPRLHSDPFLQQGEALTRGGAHLFGSSVAVSENGDTALISEEGQDAVWVYTRSGSTWTEQAELSAPDNEAVNLFGAHVALSADGNTALISDPGHQTGAGGACGCGACAPPREEPKYTEFAAWIFTRSGSTWSQGQRLAPREEGERHSFAFSIALSSNGNTALMGYEGGDWVFRRQGSTWSQGEKLPATREVGGGGLGEQNLALSADGDTALVGAAGESPSSGAVLAFTRSGSTWSQDEILTGAGETVPDGEFGESVALSGGGNTALVGGDAEDRGSVWVFTRSGSTWTPQERLSSTGNTNVYELGPSVLVKISADGSTALVSGGRESRNGRADPVWVFTRSGAAWNKGEKLAGGAGEFGASVALSGEGQTMLVGEPVEQLKQPTSCLGLVEPFDLRQPFQDDLRAVPQAQQAAATNPVGESGRVWVFQGASTVKQQQEEGLPKQHHEEAARKKAARKARKKNFKEKDKTDRKGRIPARVRARLLKDARRAAALHGDNHPYDIRAVLTTRVRAPGGGGGGDNPVCASSPSCATWPTYVVALRGDFQLPGRGRGRPGVEQELTPPAKVMVFTVPAKKGPYPMGYGDWFGLGGRYPNLNKMGIPVLLAAKSR